MSYISINQSNYFHNLDLISKKIGSKERLYVVLKDNAYGHGLRIMAELSSKFGIKKCAVKTLKEALEIKDLFEYILVLSDIGKEKPDKIAFAINDLKTIDKLPKGSLIELKVDTGMHRNGINIKDIAQTIKAIVKKGLILKGVFSHFKSADELSSEYFWQKENFKEVKKEVKRVCGNLSLTMPFFHSHNSAGIFRNNSFDDDFARSGISTYGYHYLSHPLANPPLKPVLSLWTEKLSSRILKKGQRVGYGGVFEAKKDMRVSTYDIGYGDGFFRYNGIGGLKLDNGLEILGRVSMDSMTLESENEKICLFSDATNLANYFNTITYEIITNLSPHIKRIIV